MRSHTDDERIVDPDETVVGRDALEAEAAALLDGAPGFGPEGAPPVARGVDVVTIVDGRISEVLTLLAKS